MDTLTISLDMTGATELGSTYGVPICVDDPMQMYREPLHRFADLCAMVGGHGTIFCITRDVLGIASQRLKELSQQGFEIASLSHDYDYNLASNNEDAIGRHLAHSRDVLEAEIGVRPTGFRAPGHQLSEALLNQLTQAGFQYDSSVVPSPTFQMARRARGLISWSPRRDSRVAAGTWSDLIAPTTPYRPGHNPYRRGDGTLVELPLAVATPLKIPVNGATLLQAPPWLEKRITSSLAQQQTIVVSLRAIDLADPSRGEIPEELREAVPELQAPLTSRFEKLTRILGGLARGRKILTCAALAQTQKPN